MKTKDFEKMWKDTKQQLSKVSQETLELLKKGESEIVKVSGKAKINFENLLLKLKKEQLFYIIGKESYKLLRKSKLGNAKLTSLNKEIKEIERQISANNKLLRKKS